MRKRFRVAARFAAASALGISLTSCVEQPSVKADMGPTPYDASGIMPCSAGALTFDEMCGWRVVRQPGGGAQIWISNIAVSNTPAYRMLAYSNGEFIAGDGTPVQVSKAADVWTVTVGGNEHYRFADALITGG